MEPDISLPWSTSLLIVSILKQVNSALPWHPISLKHVLILFTHLCLGLLSGLFPTGFLAKILYPFIFPFIHAQSSSFIWSPVITFDEQHKSWSSSLLSLLLFRITLSLPGPTVSLSTLFRITHSIWSSFSVTQEVCQLVCKWGVEVKLDVFLSLTLHECQWIASCCHCFLPLGKISCYHIIWGWMVLSSQWTTGSTTIICASIGLQCWCLKYRL